MSSGRSASLELISNVCEWFRDQMMFCAIVQILINVFRSGPSQHFMQVNPLVQMVIKIKNQTLSIRNPPIVLIMIEII